MNTKGLALILMVSLISNGCATASKSLLLGAAVGGTAGAGVGQGASHNSKGTVVGALIGAGLGSLIGYAAYSSQKKKEEAAKLKIDGVDDLTPSLTKPRVRSYVVPDTIEGNKYIKSHKVYILEDPGAWSKD